MKKIACALAISASLTAPAMAQEQALVLGGVSTAAAAAGVAVLAIVAIAAGGNGSDSTTSTTSTTR